MLTRLNDLIKKHQALSTWVLILLAVIVYQGVLACGFVLDDVSLILQNPYIKNPHLWRQIFLAPMWAFLGHGAESSFYRPLGMLSIWLVCRVAGLNPVGYHVLQLALYILGIWMVFKIGRKLLGNELAAFAGALIWTLHPAHVEAVAWPSAIPDIGCGFFCLLGFWFFLRAEAQSPPALRHYALAAAMFFPALFFKELAFTFPLLILVYWFCFSSGASWRQRLVYWLPYVAAGVICAILRVAIMGHFSQNSLFRGFRPKVAWVAIALLGEHAKVLMWPVNLSEFREFQLAPSLHSPWPWMTMAVLAAAVVWRKRDPLLSFLLLWWVVLLLPCFDYRQLSFPLVEDQFSYLPSVGPCLALAYLIFEWAPKRFPNLVPTRVAAAAMAVVAVLWGVECVHAIPRWRDNDALFDYGLRVSPNTAMVRVSHGVVLQFRNDLPGAAREYRTALKLNAESLRPLPPLDYDAYIGLGQIALIQGREPEALDYFNKAVHLLPHFSFGYEVLGAVYFPHGDYARAAEYFRKAVNASPLDTSARFYLGTCLVKLGQPAQAAEQFHAAREADPTYLQAYGAEAAALEAAGDHAQAVRIRSEMSSIKDSNE